MSQGVIPFVLLGFSVLITAIMSLIGFVVYGISRRLDGFQTKEICKILHDETKKDVDGIAKLVRGSI